MKEWSSLAGDEEIEFRKLTPEEKQQAFAAMERAQQLSKKILARRGGKPLPPSWQIIDEMRKERTAQLVGEDYCEPESQSIECDGVSDGS